MNQNVIALQNFVNCSFLQRENICLIKYKEHYVHPEKSSTHTP